MNLLKKLAQDSLWLLIARIVAQGSMVIVTYLLARHLGAIGFGEYSFMAAMIVFGNVLTTFGSDMVLIRQIAANGDLSDMPSMLALQLGLTCLFIVAIFLFAGLLPDRTSDGFLAVRVYSFALIPMAFYTVFTSLLRGLQKMTTYAWLFLGIAVMQVFAVVVFVQRGVHIVELAYLLLGVQIIGTVIAGVLCLPFISIVESWTFPLNKLISVFVICQPVAFIAILVIIYQKMSLALLLFLGSASLVGLFSAAARVMEVTRIGHFALFTALYPMLANTDRESQGTIRFLWFFLLIISIAGSLLLFLLAGFIVDVFYGSKYQLSIPVLKILSFTLIPYTINSFLSLMFLANKREKTVLCILGIAAFLLLILNVWLIPIAGYIGAAWAALIAESIQAILFLWAWLSKTFRQINRVSSKGVLYEISDLPR
ncbi:MAG TPA: polysaccharide biosynthesis C-terminal domain-containing protein [Anaerolineales bacterium]|nr:polysaccharide biosynthesis C-terminal domain-containing protein [Anaerolineales bacterium]